jgi:hypothetical protein
MFTKHSSVATGASSTVSGTSFSGVATTSVSAFLLFLSFLPGFWQMLVILSVMNLMDRFLVDDFWVGHTKAWTIPGTEDLKPYITAKDKQKKWLFGTVGMAAIAAVLAAMMTVQ